MKLILASASPRRAEILRGAGIPFSVITSAVDETPLPQEPPEVLVCRLAKAKAELVAARSIGPAIVISADTIVVLDEKILGKPRDTEDARRMLEQLSGRSHTVLTGVRLIRLPDATHLDFVESTLVYLRALSGSEISSYVATGEPFDKAGAYAIQGQAARFIPRIEGDFFNVVGLPLARLVSSLHQLGWSDQSTESPK